MISDFGMGYATLKLRNPKHSHLRVSAGVENPK